MLGSSMPVIKIFHASRTRVRASMNPSVAFMTRSSVTQRKTLVMVEHDMRVVFDLADTITVLVYGQVVASGPPAEIRANRAVQEAYLGALAA